MADTRIIYGFHAVTSRLRQDAGSVREIYFDQSRNDRRARDLARTAGERGVRVMMVDSARLDGIAGNTHHQGVAARVESLRLAQDLDEVLDGLKEPALLL